MKYSVKIVKEFLEQFDDIKVIENPVLDECGFRLKSITVWWEDK